MLGNREENGIIQRSLKDIFRLCDPETDSIGIAFYEIYNEKVFDLLSQSSLKGKITIVSHYMCVCGPLSQIFFKFHAGVKKCHFGNFSEWAEMAVPC